MIHKTTRSILSVLLAALLLVTSTPLTPAVAEEVGAVSLQSESGEGGELTGSGTEDDPYKIATAADLLEFADKVNNKNQTSAWAELTADIDLSSVCSKEKGNWTPIGNSSNEYRGTFNGAGHTISGLYIDSSDNDQGLFGYVGSSGKVQNLSVSGSVKGDDNVGGVVGQNRGSVENCYNTGAVNSSGNRVGGVVGYNSSGTVKNCYNTGAVNSSGNWVGGVVGVNSGSVTNCYNTGAVSGSDWYVGGVVGWNDRGTVTNCYNTGKVSGNSYVGGVAGGNSSIGTVTGCYFLQTTGVNESLPGIGRDDSATGATAAAVKDLSELCEKFKDTTNTWSIHPVLGRPVLNENKEGGLGTEASPYEISTADELKNFATAVNGGEKSAHAKLMNNIDLSSVCGESLNGGTSWNPIGTSISNSYTGTFDGQNFKISGLYIKNTSSDYYQGLFGYLGTSGDNKGTVQNLTVSGTVSGGWHVGGVVGYNNGGTVTGCIFSGSGSVSGEWYVGGIAGQNNGTVENCYNTGQVNGRGNYVGGVVGWNDSGANVENCYNTGSVTGVTGAAGSSDYVGGVVGLNSGNVENCYNTGTVTGTDDYVGGVVGWNRGTVKNCYYQIDKGALVGIDGTTADDTTTVAKTAAEFHSGEVAWRLQAGQKAAGEEDPIPQVWGQSALGTEDSLPTLVALNPDAAKEVYQLTFDWRYEGAPEGTTTTTNVYTNGSVAIPEINHDRAGYHISDWKDKNGQPVTAETTVGKDAVFIAEWTANTYTITVTAGSGGTVSGSGEYSEGTEVTVTATPATGYRFTGWMENDRQVSTDATYTFKATGDRTLTAKFEKKVTGVTLNTETLELFTGGSATLTATVEPSDAANQNVTWQSDNANVATVEGGTVTAVGAGETTIIVQTQDGNYTATCKVTVTQSTYSISADTTALNFGSAYTGYAQPAAQTVTVENTGNQPVILNQPSSTDNFVVGNLTDTELAAGETATFTVQPKAGLAAGTYSETIMVSGTNNNVTLPITASFTVKSRPSYNPPTVSEETTDAIADAQPGETVTVDLSSGSTTLDKEVFETLAGKDVTLVVDLGDGVSWTVNGSDIPEDADFTDIDLNVTMNSDGIPVDVVNAITGEVGTVQITLAHDGEFGFTMTLSAPLGEENAGYWANLYHYDEEAEKLNFEAATKIDEDGSVTIPFSHASQYAIVIDTHSHAAVDVSDLFIDIAPDAWYKDAIQYAYDNGLMTGVSANEFAPEATTTRAMIVSILARLEGVTTAEAAGFADVDDNDWYATAVNWAANVGVVNGYEDNTFRPNTAITREQLAAILMNYAAYKGEDVSNRADLTSYTDQPSTWAEEAMSWAVAEGLLTGVTADTLQPQGAATRAQVAAILQRFLSE